MAIDDLLSDTHLLFNFGLAANTNTPQEYKDKKLVSELMHKGRNIASGGSFNNPVEMMAPVPSDGVQR